MLEETMDFNGEFKNNNKSGCCLSPLLPSVPPGEFRARSKDTEQRIKSPEAELEFCLRILKTEMDDTAAQGTHEGPTAE